MHYHYVTLDSSRMGSLMGHAKPSSEFIRQAVEIAKAERPPLNPPAGLDMFGRALFAARVKARRRPLSPKNSANKQSHTSKVASFFRGLGLH